MTDREETQTVGEVLEAQGISRRSFLKFCAATASMLAMPPLMGRAMAKQLASMKRPSVIYLSFQECTGCLESLTRSFSPTLETLIFNVISLDYDDTLMAAAGEAAEKAKDEAMRKNRGKYLLIVDGAVPLGDGGVYHTAAGRSAEQILAEASKGAAAVVAVGTCAAFGGLPLAAPNPTGAVPVSHLVRDKPVVNVSGCPPIPAVITGTLIHYYTQGRLPDLDGHGRPLAFYGNSIHDRCYRRPFYDKGQFAKSFDDEGARNGWCLWELGCKGPVTSNACATMKWNEGTSFPIESGHPCLGCAEPGFWDGGSFYSPLATGKWGRAGQMRPKEVAAIAAPAAGVGALVGAGAAAWARGRRRHAEGESGGEED
ncbi:MAG TPA: hydrogenase small subunit [Gammaproteobacteria bacterium]|nr:hydrogenase small subunit [Gammaproteobacteria bacterium]